MFNMNGFIVSVWRSAADLTDKFVGMNVHSKNWLVGNVWKSNTNVKDLDSDFGEELFFVDQFKYLFFFIIKTLLWFQSFEDLNENFS